MRFWFSQVPIYPQRVRDFTRLIFGGAGVAIAAAVACLALPAAPRLPAEPRLLVTFGTWFLLGLLVLLVGRSWARRRGLPFVPLQDAKALTLVKEGTRPLPDALLWNFLPSGVLSGLIVAQIIGGHPFWQTDKLSWTMVAACGIGTVIGCVRRRAKAASRSRMQEAPT